MTISDKLNVIGFIVSGIGSSLGMIGIFKQTNAYYPFKPAQFIEHIYRIVRKYVREGTPGARAQVDTAAKLAERKGEDRGLSLIGLYFVFFGFLLQFLGSFLLLLGTLLANSLGATPR
jgi:hypothetical protein